MPSQKVQFTVKGMSRDLADSKFNPEFAFENKNIRITPTENSTLLVLSNEKGNAVIDTHPKDKDNTTCTIANRQVLGYAVLYKTIVLFFKATYNGATNTDCISKIGYTNNNDGTVTWNETVLYAGNLGFEVSSPIETLPLYEAEDIQKVYWVDGKNQPRVINIAIDADHIIRDNDNTQFDFLPTLALTETVTITRSDNPTGKFPAGALQYAITYSKRNGQESKVAWISTVIYTVTRDGTIYRGGAPNELTTGSYKISIPSSGVDTRFDVINIYSIMRSSEDAGLQTKLVARIDIVSNPPTNYEYTDTNTSGETIAPTDLLFKGGEKLIANTLSTKDNTLFLGNIQYSSNWVTDDIRNGAKNCTVMQSYTNIQGWEETSGFYPYKNPLLNNVSTYLKAGNMYRLGLQLQDENGGWSEPLFVKDFSVTYRPNIDISNHSLNIPKVQIELDSTFKNDSLAKKYKKIRPIVVYPTPDERGVIAQGIVCPTVFRKESRLANNPFAQSSWFFRPYNGNGYGGDALSKYSVEARHGHSLAGANKYNAEVQNAKGTENYALSTDINPQDYYVDGSIIDFYSPDINDSLQENELTNSSIKIVGAFAIDACAGRVSLVANAPISTVRGYGKVSPSLSNVDKSIGESWDRNLFGTQTLWKDIFNPYLATPYYYATYPWHRGNLWLNKGTGLWENVGAAADLASKVISNIRISQNFDYYSSDISGQYSPRTIRDIRIFRKENGDSAYALQPADNPSDSCRFGNLYYKGTISSAIISSSSYPIYAAANFNDILDKPTPSAPPADEFETSDPIYINYRSTDHVIIALENDSIGRSMEMPVPYFTNDPNGDKTISKYNKNLFWLENNTNIFSAGSRVVFVYESEADYFMADYADSDYVIKCQDPVGTLEYPFNLTVWQYVAPDPEDPSSQAHLTYAQLTDSYSIFDVKNATLVGSLSGSGDLDDAFLVDSDDGHTWAATSKYNLYETLRLPTRISTAASSGNEVMWITELVRDIPDGIFGGESGYAIKNNSWYPCGEAVDLATATVVDVTEGDTIFNRWDCLKTLPYTAEDQNQIVEIMSFMCESYVNTAGRYDKNQGLADYTFLTSAVPFNQMNSAYNNKDSFFTYRITDLEKNKETLYPTLVTWSLTKTLGEDIDSWTHVVLASSLNMDGDRGKVRALRRYKNSIFAFQDKGVAEIIYNPSTAIASSAGVPIEIANSGKVEGKRYVSENIGCTNKWSICTTPAGIYFIDSIDKKLYLWSDNGMVNLSEKMGFTSWFNGEISKVIEDWNPIDCNDFVTQYDRTVGDVYFINENKCLAFNESLGQFSSFYDYEKTPFFINLDNHCLTVHNGLLWEQHAGNYNSFFGVNNRPYYTEVVVNPNPTEDKIFDNIEFRADSWNGSMLLDTTFDKLTTFNEYQYGECALTWLKGYPSTLKKKFRVWYANIPRDDVSKRDRMRNTWLHLKLEKHNPGTERTVLHDLQVKYFI